MKNEETRAGSEDRPAKIPGPDEPMVCVVVLNGSITAEWDTGPWRGQSTSRFMGGWGHHTY